MIALSTYPPPALSTSPVPAPDAPAGPGGPGGPCVPVEEVLCLEPSAKTISFPTTTSESKATVGINVIAELSSLSMTVPAKVTEPVFATDEIV